MGNPNQMTTPTDTPTPEWQYDLSLELLFRNNIGVASLHFEDNAVLGDFIGALHAAYQLPEAIHQRNTALAKNERLVVALKEARDELSYCRLVVREEGSKEDVRDCAIVEKLIKIEAALSSESPTLTLAEEVERIHLYPYDNGRLWRSAESGAARTPEQWLRDIPTCFRGLFLHESEQSARAAVEGEKEVDEPGTMEGTVEALGHLLKAYKEKHMTTPLATTKGGNLT